MAVGIIPPSNLCDSPNKIRREVEGDDIIILLQYPSNFCPCDNNQVKATTKSRRMGELKMVIQEGGGGSVDEDDSGKSSSSSDVNVSGSLSPQDPIVFHDDDDYADEDLTMVAAAISTTTSSPHWYHRPRIIYTAVFVWISVTGGRFLAEFLEQELNMGPQQIGSLLALQKFVGVMSSSLAGHIADMMEERDVHKRQVQVESNRQGHGRVAVLRWGVIISTICFCLHGSHRLVSRSSSMFTSNNTDSITTAATTTNTIFDKVFDTLPWYVMLRMIYAVGGSFVFPIIDAICIDYLKKEGRQGDYGKERLFGAISWAITNFIIGPCLDYTQDFAIVLYPMSIVATVGVLACLQIYETGSTSSSASARYHSPVITTKIHPGIKRRTSDLILDSDNGNKTDTGKNGTSDFVGNLDEDLPSTTDDDQAQQTQQHQRSSRMGFISVFSVFGTSLYSVAFLIALVALASGQAVVNDLVFLLFEYLGSTYSLMSFTVVLTVSFEIPLFQIAPKLLEKFGSSGLMIIASICYIVRVIGYTLIPTGKTAWVLLLEPLHGVTYAASQTASVDFAANMVSQSGSEALAQGALQFFIGGGSVLGLGFGGWIQERWGPVAMYRGSAVVVIIGVTVLGSSLKIRERIRRGMLASRIRHYVIPQEDWDNVTHNQISSLSSVEMVDQMVD